MMKVEIYNFIKPYMYLGLYYTCNYKTYLTIYYSDIYETINNNSKNAKGKYEQVNKRFVKHLKEL